MNKTLLCAAVGALVCTSGAALAYEKGDMVLRAGYANVSPEDSSDSIQGLGASNARVGVDSGASLGLGFTYMMTNNVGLEVLGALPFTHDIGGTGDLAGVDIGETKQLPPTVSVQYYMPLGNNVQGYAGVGVNYTVFFDEKTAGTLAGDLGASTTDLSLEPSAGIAFEAGFDWKVAENWYVNAAVWKIDIDTEADVIVNGATFDTIDVEIDPMVYMLGATIAF